MFGKQTTALTCSLMIVAVSWFCLACKTSSEPPRTNEPAPHVEPAVAPIAQLLPAPSPTATPTPVPKSAVPPSATEIQEAVARVFKSVAIADTARNSSFAVGDFNGDGAEDLAVVVKASEGALGNLNSEMANWILEDPRKVPPPSLSNKPPPHLSVRAEKGDSLLAIIHGVNPQGWRSPEAKQTFLLKNGAGARLLSQGSAEIKASRQQLPPIRGDVLNETLDNKSGFIFWTGAKYSWWVSTSQ